MFSIVQTKKTVRSKPEMSKVPVGWLVKDKLYWPPNNLKALIEDPTSKADPKSWKAISNFKVIGKPMKYAAAESTMQQLSQMTDSDDAVLMDRGTRSTKAKSKQKFTSNLYKLEPPKKELVSVHFLLFVQIVCKLN